MVILRQGQINDADVLADLIVSSAPILLPYLFGGQQQVYDYIRQAGRQSDGQYSAFRHQMAVLDNKVVACITLWHSQMESQFQAETLQSLVRFLSASQIQHLIGMNAVLNETFLVPTNKQLCVGHLSVLEAHWGCGIGKKLIAYAIREAKRLEKSSLVLDVDCENAQAISFYHSCGFIERCENTFPFTSQRFFRMQRLI